jgi:predicted kinase
VEGIIFIGLQGSGKSQFYRERFFNSHARISRDLLKTRNRENRFLELCLELQQPFVIDNTNPTVDDRKRYIEPARARGYCIIGYFFEVDIGLALKRNESRQGREKIPKVGIFTTRKRMQPPTLSEGFDKLYVVRSGEDQQHFLVEELKG